jgi:hypothetical protein
MVRAPKSLAITFAGSKVVGHLVVLACKLSVRTDRVRTSKKQVCEKWTLTILRFCGLNSLLPLTNSLLFEIFSLLICTGNCAKNRCGTAVSCSKIVSGSPEIAVFPVKFPVSREFAWRRVRSALRRQPGSPAIGETVPDTRRKARQWRAFAIWPPVSGSDFGCSRSDIADSLRRTFEKFPFLGDCGRRPGSICTDWSSMQCNWRILRRGGRRIGNRAASAGGDLRHSESI